MKVAGKKRTLWFVAAGTGGHIFPGLRIAEYLESVDPQFEFLFFGSQRRLESEIVPKHGRKIYFLKASPWKGKGIVSRVMALVDLTVGFFQALWQSFKMSPDALVSVGGYVSLPVALAMVLRRKKIFLIEPNIRAGISNRLISRFANIAYTTPGSDAEKVFHCPVKDFGNPVRASFGRCESETVFKEF
jgi:UDP-N-acetylglucosamine--N-acetylmuramyl-(pentapeptide) pyrophosphoryl-undecaprenol N-acetylglucosamine transferase